MPREGFLSKGVTVANFRQAWTEPLSKHLFRKDYRPRPTDSINDLKYWGCITSKGQKEGLRVGIIYLRDCREMGLETSQETSRSEIENPWWVLGPECLWIRVGSFPLSTWLLWVFYTKKFYILYIFLKNYYLQLSFWHSMLYYQCHPLLYASWVSVLKILIINAYLQTKH